MANTEFTIKQGATGATLTETLSDENGAVDFTDFQSVKFYARAIRATTNVIDGVTCTIDPDQEANTGKISFVLDTYANVELGEYDTEFHATDAAGKVHIFPTPGFGRLIVEASLSNGG